MASFASMPNELLIQIFEYCEGDSRTLHSISLSSVRLRRLSIKILYRTIYLPPTKVDGNLPCLIRSLIYRPEHAQQVKRLSFSVSQNSDGHESPQAPDYRNPLLPRLSSRSITFGFPRSVDHRRMRATTDIALIHKCSEIVQAYRDALTKPKASMLNHWHILVEVNYQIAYGGILLSLVPNLIDLSLVVYLKGGSEKLFQAPLKGLFGAGYNEEDYRIMISSMIPSLRNLRRLKIKSSNLSLLHLQFAALESLEVDFTHDLDIIQGGYDHPYLLHPFPPSKAIQSLVLHCHWDDILYGVLIQSSPTRILEGLVPTTLRWCQCHITSLQIIFIRSDLDHGDSVEPIQFSALAILLQAVRPSLRILRIDSVDDPDPSFNRADPVHQAFDDFRGFDQLREMIVLSTFILDYEYGLLEDSLSRVAKRIPRTIEKLTLIGLDWSVLLWLGDLAILRTNGSIQNLRRIDLVSRPGWGMSFASFTERVPPCLDELSRLFIDVRVRTETESM